MPIRPENKDRYPKDWAAISLRIREKAGQVCEFCGVKNYALGKFVDGKWHDAHPKGNGKNDWPKAGEVFPCHFGDHVVWAKVVRIVLTVAHLDHIPEHCGDDNLKALCQRCHNTYDMPMRRAGIAERARIKAASGDLFLRENGLDRSGLE